MNTLKRISAIVLALVMVLSLGVTVFANAAPSPYTGSYEITVKKVANDTAKHDYNAYQIFKGDLAVDGTKKVLSNIEWGASIPTADVQGEKSLAKMIEALVAIDLDPDGSHDYPFAGCETAEDFAEVLGKNTTKDNAAAVAFAAAIKPYLTTVVATGESEVINQADIDEANAWNQDPSHTDDQKEVPAPKYGDATITVEGPGYYLIEDQDNSGTGDSAKTKYIMQVLDDVEVEEKTDVPTVDKVIDENGGVKQNEVSIGDKVPYKVTSAVPDMKYYDNYWFIFNDTLSKGLTFQNDVTVKIGENTLTRGVDYDVYINGQLVSNTTALTDLPGDDGTEIRIVMKDLKDYCTTNNIDPKTVIEVTYSAILNEQANVTKEGNPNEVDLEFSNNPNEDYDGDGHDNDGDKPTGKTPKSKTETFTTGVKIFKYYLKDGQKTALAGAKFTIKGTALNKVVEYGTVFIKEGETDEVLKELGVDTSAEKKATYVYEYWKLKDGTYTKTSPLTEGIDKSNYEGYVADPDNAATLPKYALVDFVKVDEQHSGEIELQGYTDDEGHLIVDGLEAGTYEIYEALAPNGFNQLKKPIILEIESVWNEKTGKYDWWYRYYEKDSEDEPTAEQKAVKPNGANDADAVAAGWKKYFEDNTTANDAECLVEIENNSGLELPGTGGMGTTIFYIVGGLMLVVALAVCVAKVMAPKAVSTKLTAENI